MKRIVRIGITLGDPNGIGPEVALKAALGRRWPAQVRLVLVGSEPLLRRQAKSLRLSLSKPNVSIWDPQPDLQPRARPGRVERDASAAAASWIRAAIAACMDGRLDAMVTGPISKEGFAKAGVHYPGHTELLAEQTGTRRFAMMLFGGPLRIILATRHVPIAQVADRLRTKEIVETICLAGEALPWLGLRRRRLAVCGLNPHAGDGGKIGREEITKIAPAIQKARRRGFDIAGPIPADVVFHHALHGRFDAVIAMYHDQGLGPLKMLAFDVGVNVTLGLPIVRTSPDHGTAFDIAGKGIANPSSMIEAVRWAARLAQRPNPWRVSGQKRTKRTGR